MLLNHLLLAGGWILYCVLHSVLAGLPVKKWVQQKTGSNARYYRLFYTLFAAASLAALIGAQLTITTTDIFTPMLLSTILGGALLLAGLSLMFVCIRKYFFSLSGLKSLFQEAPSSELMIGGIHRFMRHPLYTGTFMAVWGLWLLFPNWSVFIAGAVITVYTLLAIRLEEEKLVNEFGDQYRQYQQQVPKLIPRFPLTEQF